MDVQRKIMLGSTIGAVVGIAAGLVVAHYYTGPALAYFWKVADRVTVLENRLAVSPTLQACSR